MTAVSFPLNFRLKPAWNGRHRNRRLGVRLEIVLKRTLKGALYGFLLFAGPVAIRNTFLRLRRNSRLTVLLYHRVNDISKDNLTTSVDRFVEHLTILKRHYNVVSLAEAKSAFREGRYLGPSTVAINFDDGYADNHEIAAQVLKHFDFPATFFVSAGLVGTTSSFKHDERSAYRFPNLTWNQVRALVDLGFEVGSHGLNHQNLGQCSLEEARREISRSRDLLERNLGTPVRSFAYPFGGREDITREVIREIRLAGFDLIASGYGGANVGRLDLENVLRVAVNDTFGGLSFRALVEGVTLGALRSRFIGWTRMERHA